MALTAGTRLGPYEIQSPLGAGGMGEVYKARDTRLDRIVAIKVLPSHIAADPSLRERFEREARAISALEHPHICPLYDVGSEGGTDFIVMQHLDGETLASRLARGPLPLDQALKVGTEIADALDAAHKRGIVHRDLKPANIFLVRRGGPSGPPDAKLLDFGLAKTAAPAVSGTLATIATQAAPLTSQGTILGTLQYMSPEQIEGRDADARTDLFALGALLYEMVTGRRAFEAQSGPSLIAAILSSEPPPLSRLQPVAPRALERLVRRCLAKTPDDRWHCARDLLLELRSIEPEPAAVSARTSGANRYLAIATALSLLLALGVMVQRLREPAPEAPVRVLELSLPATAGFGTGSAGALSPDGRQMVYTALDDRGRVELRVRQLDGIADRLLATTRGAHGPFWSPDNRWVAYYDDNALMRVQVNAGVPERLARVSNQGRGGSWSRDGQILFTDESLIKRLSLDTKEIVEATTLDRAAGEGSHRWPAFLGDGRRFVFTAFNNDPERSAIMLGSLDGGRPKRLVPAASRSVVAGGYLLFSRDGALMVQSFDQRSGEVGGDAVRLAREVAFISDTGAASFSVDDRGTLAFQAGGGNPIRLRWYDRSGTMLRDIPHDPFRIGGSGLDLSPDGLHAAVTRVQEDGTTDIWLVDLARATMSRLTSHPRNDRGPIWTPDGRSVVFEVRGDKPMIIRKPADGSAPESTLMQGDQTGASGDVRAQGLIPLIPQDVSKDGGVLLYTKGRTGGDLFALDLTAGTTTPVVQGPYSDGQAQFSPDDSWVAYSSDETGALEVYVQRFPGGADRVKVSTAGGQMPRWSPDGRTLYYVTLTGDLMAVAIDYKTARAAIPERLFRTALGGVVANQAFRYAPSPDGTRFLIADGATAGGITMQIVTNWPELMRRQK